MVRTNGLNQFIINKLLEPKWLAQLEKRLSALEDNDLGRSISELTRVIAVTLQQCSTVNRQYEELKSRLLDCREHCDELDRQQRSKNSFAKGARAAILLQQLLCSCIETYQQTRNAVEQNLIL